MLTLDVKQAARSVEAKARKLGSQVKKTIPQILESEARNIAISLAKSTQPYGTGEEAREKGEAAVRRDIGKVYATSRDVFAAMTLVGERDQAKAYWALTKSGRSKAKTGAAQALLAHAGSRFGANTQVGRFNPALHQSARDSRTGRVRQRTPSLVVTNPAALQRYAAKRMGNVGYGKSGWANVARQLGGIRGLRNQLPGGERDITANWITRQRGPASVVRNFSSSKPTIFLHNQVPYADEILSAGARSTAIRIARERLIKQAIIAARYEARHAAKVRLF